jgi:KDO2-lipid IV(A) lauroyltransferase
MYSSILTENPDATTDGEISEMHTRRLEKDIIANPETWLWSHRRWKHKRPPNS